MHLAPEQLISAGYIVLDKLPHDDMLPFIKTYSKQKTRASLFFTLSNLFSLALAVALCTFFFLKESAKGMDLFVHICYGFSLAFLLIPIHEVLHAIAYKYVGAPKTSYFANLKKFYFAAVAPNFVTSRREFRIVALLPFLCITALCLLATVLLPMLWSVTAAGTLLAHTAFCSGDFALLSYFEVQKDRKPITYDDAEQKISYFLGMPEAPV